MSLRGSNELDSLCSSNSEIENTRKSARLLLKKSDVPISEIDSKAGVLWSMIGCVGLDDKIRKRKMIRDEGEVRCKKINLEAIQEPSASKKSIIQKRNIPPSTNNFIKRQRKINKDCCVSNELKKLNKNAHSKFLRSGSRTGHVKSEGARWREFMREGIQDQGMIRKRRKISKTKQNNLHLKKWIGDCQSKEEMHGYLIKCIFEDAMMPPRTVTYQSQFNSYLAERQLIRNIINEEEFVNKMEQLKLTLISVFRENSGLLFRQHEQKIMNHILKSFNSYFLSITLDAMLNDFHEIQPKIGESLSCFTQLSPHLYQFLYGSSEPSSNSVNLKRKCVNPETSVFYKSMYLVYLMERIKINKLLKTDPPLINKLSKFKRSVQILMELRDMLFTVSHSKSCSKLKDSLTDILNEYFHYRQLTSYEFHDSVITTYNSLFSIARLEEYVRITTGKVLKLYPLKKFYKNDGGFKSLKRNMTLLRANGFSLTSNIDVSSTVKENNLKVLWELVFNQLKTVKRPFKRVGFAVLFCIYIKNGMQKIKNASPDRESSSINNEEHINESDHNFSSAASDLIEVADNFNINNLNTSQQSKKSSDAEPSLILNVCKNKNSKLNSITEDRTHQRNSPLDLTVRDKIVGRCNGIISIRRAEPYDYSEMFSNYPSTDSGLRSSRTCNRLKSPKVTEDSSLGYSPTFDVTIPSNDSCYDSLEPLSNESNIECHNIESEFCKKNQSQGSEEIIDVITVVRPLITSRSRDNEINVDDVQQTSSLNIYDEKDLINRKAVSFLEKSNVSTEDKDLIEKKPIDNFDNKPDEITVKNLQEDSNERIISVYKETNDTLDAAICVTKKSCNITKQIEHISRGLEKCNNCTDCCKTNFNSCSSNGIESSDVHNFSYDCKGMYQSDKSEKSNIDNERLELSKCKNLMENYPDLSKNCSEATAMNLIQPLEVSKKFEKDNNENTHSHEGEKDSSENLCVNKTPEQSNQIINSVSLNVKEDLTNLQQSDCFSAESSTTSFNNKAQLNDKSQKEFTDNCNKRNDTSNINLKSDKELPFQLAKSESKFTCNQILCESKVDANNGKTKFDAMVALRLKKCSNSNKIVKENLKNQPKTKPFDFIKTSLSLGSGYEGLQEPESTDSSWLEDLDSSAPVHEATIDSSMLLQNFGPSFSYFDSGVNLIQLSSFGSNVNCVEPTRYRDPYSYRLPSHSYPTTPYDCHLKDSHKSFQQHQPIDYRTSSFLDSKNGPSKHHPRSLESSSSSYPGNHSSRPISNPYNHSSCPPFYHYSIQYPTSSPHSFYPESYYSPSALPYSVPSTNYNSNTFNFFIDNRSSHTYLPQSNLPPFAQSTHSPFESSPFSNNVRGRLEMSNDSCPSSECYAVAPSNIDPIQNIASDRNMQALSRAKTALQQSLKRKRPNGPSQTQETDSVTSVDKNEIQAPPSISSPEIREILNSFLDNGSNRSHSISQNTYLNAQPSAADPSVRCHAETSGFHRSCAYVRNPVMEHTYSPQNQILTHPSPPFPHTKLRHHHSFPPPHHQDMFYEKK